MLRHLSCQTGNKLRGVPHELLEQGNCFDFCLHGCSTEGDNLQVSAGSLVGRTPAHVANMHVLKMPLVNQSPVVSVLCCVLQ